MTKPLARLALLLCPLWAWQTVPAQQTPPAPPASNASASGQQESLGDAARRLQAQPIPPASTGNASAGQESLADAARRLHKNQQAEVRMTADDEKELFRAVDKLSSFASSDTGYPLHRSVERRMVSSKDVENFMRRVARSTQAGS